LVDGCYSRVLAADVALDRLWVQLLAIDAADCFGLDHVWLGLGPRDDALDMHCELGVGFGVVCEWQVGLDGVGVYVNGRQARVRLREWRDRPVKMQW
jgi:hypothetical protein